MALDDLNLPGLGAGLGGTGTLGLMGGLSGPMDAGGNDIASFYVIDAPDDRYIAGYSATQVDGDSKTVGPRLKDLNIPFSLYGLPIPITFGVRKLYSNIIWAIPLRENIKKKSQTGKGGSAIGVASSTTEYEYYATYAVAFGYPGLPDVGDRKVIRVWADGTLIYNRRGTGQQKIAGFNFRFYDGSEEQLADPLMEEREGVGFVPGYRGLMYMVIDDLPVKGWGDRPPAISVEIGDLTESSYSITNIPAQIFPPVTEMPGGTTVMSDIVVDTALGYAYTLTNSLTFGYPVRTFDLNSAQLVSTVRTNQGAGIGWVGNTSNYFAATLAQWTGLLSAPSQRASYIPWLGLIMGQSHYFSAGSAPFMLLDPISGAVINWIGSTDEGPNIAYPIADTFVLAGLDPEKRHYAASIPHIQQIVPQIVYTAFASDTYMAFRTIYGDFGMLKLDGITGELDMNYYDGFDYDSIAPGGVYTGHSDFYGVIGSVITRYRVTAGARRIFVNPGSYAEGVLRETFHTATSGINNIYYYKNDDALIVFLDNGHIYKLDLITLTKVWEVSGVTLPAAHTHLFWLNDTSNGFLSWENGTIFELDLTFGTYATYPIGSVNYFVLGNPIIDSATKSAIGIGTGGLGSAGTDQTASMDDAVSRYFYDRVEDVRISLADFIRGIAVYAGYDTGDIEISADIDDMIDGAILISGTTFRRIMDVVDVLYRIDMIESDGKIKFTRKAVGYTGSDFTVADGETLLPSPQTPQDPTFQFRREEESLMPKRINVQYIDKAMDYQWAMMTATRAHETTESTNDITYQIPIVMTASEAKTLANRVMYYAWNSRMSFNFRLASKFFKIEPGDVGQVTSMGMEFTIKAIEVTYNNDFSIGIKGTSFLSDTVVEIEGYAGVGYPQVITPLTGAQTFILDLPLIQPGDDLNYAGAYPLYVQVSPLTITNAWVGGTALFSTGGIDYSTLASNTGDGIVMTVITDTGVPDSILSIDTDGYMDVVIRAGDITLLSSATFDELQTGSNLCAYGADGRWELIQYENVTDLGSNKFRLSNIYRGLRGTDYAVDFHQPGDTLILLNLAWTSVFSFTHDQTEISFNYKGVGFGQNPALVMSKRTTLHGYGAMPWSPTIPKIDRSIVAGTGDLTFKFNRRDRVTGVIADGGENVLLRYTEENEYKMTITRWPHYEWTWDGSFWQFNVSNTQTAEFIIDGIVAPDSEPIEFSIPYADIRTAKLYEHLIPDDFADEFTTWSIQSANVIDDNEEANLQMVDLGYDEFTAFKYLDVMIQQKTKVPNASGYGIGRKVRVTIRDT